MTVWLATDSDESVLPQSPSVDSAQRSYTRVFSLDLSIKMQSADSAYLSPSNFPGNSHFATMHGHSNLQNKMDEMCRFSVSTDISSAFFVDNVPYTPIFGFISSSTRHIACSAAQD